MPGKGDGQLLSVLSVFRGHPYSAFAFRNAGLLNCRCYAWGQIGQGKIESPSPFCQAISTGLGH